MSPRTGRPPSDNPRRHVVPVRLTDEDHATLSAASEQAGRTLSAYLREAALAKARRSRVVPPGAEPAALGPEYGAGPVPIG